MIALSNTTMLNSGINNVTFELAGVQELNSNMHPTNIGLTRRNLMTDSDANQMRDAAKADLAVLLIDGNFMNGDNSPVFGVADIIVREEEGYCVVEADAAMGRFTLTHELAHLFGADHEDGSFLNRAKIFTTRSNCRPCWWWPFRNCCEDVERRTMMANLPVGQSRIMHFSNPNVSFEGVSTGDVDRNNASVIRDNSAAVANFRPAVFSGSISGPFDANTNENVNFCFETCACGGNPTINWQLSTDGFNFESFGTTNCASFTMPNQLNVFVRAVITCGTETTTLFQTVTNFSTCQFCLQEPLTPTNASSTSPKISVDSAPLNVDLLLYPNPSSDILNLDYKVELKDNVRIDLYEGTGRLVKNILNSYKTEGHYKEMIQTERLQAGFYICRVQIGNKILNRRFVINH